MKIPAIRSRIGQQTFYTASLTFKQISDNVSAIDDQLHTSVTLRDLIQRSITENYLSIKNYIINQDELFFNSLVLAVYDDYPEWQEIEVKFGDEEYYQIGLLNFPGHHKIFPVDGQHRVQGIKAAILENPDLKNNNISVIFIGHDNSNKQKTRRLFTTLNRYAKPVSLRDIIALDEDDTIAIVTRLLLEEFELFKEDRIVDIRTKAIPSSNKEALTSIISLYQTNILIGKNFYQRKFDKKPTKKNFNENFLKFRPNNEVIDEFRNNIFNFWTKFSSNLSCINSYGRNTVNKASYFRNSENGGVLLFRPIGIVPFVQAVLIIMERNSSLELGSIFEIFNEKNLNLNSAPWQSVIWNSLEGKMIMNQSALTRLLLIYLFDKSLLNPTELMKVKEGYAAALNMEQDEVYDHLDLL